MPARHWGTVWVAGTSGLIQAIAFPHACCLHAWLQGQVLLLVMELMRGGSLRAALQSPQKRERLRWEAG